MFQDEARFGRINDPRYCWAPPGCRPIVPKQIVREYTYLYGAFSPKDGVSDLLVLPAMNAMCMNVFLKEVAARHPDDFILMVYDGAPCHKKSALTIPEHMMLEILPPYSPQLNPSENIWDHVREKNFENHVFESMEAVENQLCIAAINLENDPKTVQSITGWHWIIKGL
jgi:DDE superfamily endonuclease